MTSQQNILQIFSHQQNLSTFSLCLRNLLRSADGNTEKKWLQCRFILCASMRPAKIPENEYECCPEEDRCPQPQSSPPHKTMLKKLVLKAHVVDSEINSMLAYTDTVCEMLYGSMETTLAQEAVKIYLSTVHVKKFKVQDVDLYTGILRLYVRVYNQISNFPQLSGETMVSFTLLSSPINSKAGSIRALQSLLEIRYSISG